MNTNNNSKIVYKKITNYYDTDSDSISDTDSDSVSNSVSNSNKNTDTNIFSQEQNLILRNNILKELTNEISNEINVFNNINNNQDNNNVCKNYISSSIVLKNFILFLKEHNINLKQLGDKLLLEDIIKKFLLKNVLSHEQIINFLKELKNFTECVEYEPLIEPNKLNKQNEQNEQNEQSVLNNMEYFDNSIGQNNVGSEKDEIFDSLKNNDINTWLFIGVIIISFIIVVMMSIHKN